MKKNPSELVRYQDEFIKTCVEIEREENLAEWFDNVYEFLKSIYTHVEKDKAIEKEVSGTVILMDDLTVKIYGDKETIIIKIF